MSNSILSKLNFRPLALAIAGILVLGLATPAVAQEAPIKIAVVNLDYIVAKSPAGQDLQGKLEAFETQVRSEVEAKTSAARAIQQRITDGANSLSDDKLADLQKQLEDATIDIRRYRDDRQREGEKMQNEGLQSIEAQLEPVFKAIRDENGYDLILNNVPGVVVMAGERVNITQQVLDRLGAGGQ